MVTAQNCNLKGNIIIQEIGVLWEGWWSLLLCCGAEQPVKFHPLKSQSFFIFNEKLYYQYYLSESCITSIWIIQLFLKKCHLVKFCCFIIYCLKSCGPTNMVCQGRSQQTLMTVCQAFLDKSDNLTFYHMGNLVQIIKCHVVWLPKNLN